MKQDKNKNNCQNCGIAKFDNNIYCEECTKLQPLVDEFIDKRQQQAQITEAQHDMALIEGDSLARIIFTNLPANAVELMDRADVAKGLADKIREQDMWVSVEDKLPIRGEYVLTINERGQQSTGYLSTVSEMGWRTDLNKSFGGCYLESDAITHWQPLPQPPIK